jgi:ribonuclease VapC
MYLDSTAILPLLLDQPDAPNLASSIEQAESALITSPISVVEAAVRLSDATGAPIAEAHDLVREFMTLGNIQLISINPEISRRATEVYAEHGTTTSDTRKLDIDEAMIYACAKAYGAPLLFTGSRFSGLPLIKRRGH